MDEKDPDLDGEGDLSVYDLWTSGLPIEEILEREMEMQKRRPARAGAFDASVVRDHTPGDLDEWLAGKDAATRPDPHEPRIVSWERH